MGKSAMRYVKITSQGRIISYKTRPGPKVTGWALLEYSHTQVSILRDLLSVVENSLKIRESHKKQK